MAKTTEKYELMYIINPNLSEEETAAVVEKFKALVEQNGSASSLTRSTTFPRATTCSSSSPAARISRLSWIVCWASRTVFSAP